jgi:hypothetical protein
LVAIDTTDDDRLDTTALASIVSPSSCTAEAGVAAAAVTTSGSRWPAATHPPSDPAPRAATTKAPTAAVALFRLAGGVGPTGGAGGLVGGAGGFADPPIAPPAPGAVV